jgi:dTDP-glucose 4,6-dehydratase
MSIEGKQISPVRALAVEDLEFVWQRTLGLWNDARGQRIFITGGTGFFGSWMLESFAYANRVGNLSAEATVLTRDPQAFEKRFPHLVDDPAIHLLEGDVRDFDFPEGSFEQVIHAASESYARETPARVTDQLTTIVQGTQRALQFAAAHGTRNFLFVSSGAIYGHQPAGLMHIGEDYRGAPIPTDAITAYGEGKRTAEALCASFGRHYGFNCKIARCFAFVGPHLPLDAHFAIGNFLRDSMERVPIRIQGDGTALRSYMYAADLAVWLWHILFRAPALEPVNVGSGEPISICALAHLVAETLGSGSQVCIARAADPNAVPERYVPSVRKAQQLLGLQCEVSLAEGIRRTAAWHGFGQASGCR